MNEKQKTSYKKHWCKIVSPKILDDEFMEIYHEHKPKNSHIKSLKFFADTVFSKYIRITKSKDWICECITCKKKMHWSKIQNWHYRSRTSLLYRFDQDNCRPQCEQCNIFKNGNYRQYHLEMVKMFGKEKEEEMRNNQRQHKIRDLDYIEMIKDWHYTIKNKNVNSKS